MENWGDSNTFGANHYCLFCRNSPLGILASGGYSQASLPYSVSDVRLDKTNNIDFFRIGFQKEFCITGKMTREILGTPSEMYVSRPSPSWNDVIRNYFAVIYGYKFKKHRLNITYTAYDIPVIDRDNSKEMMGKASSISVYENHKNICASKADIEKIGRRTH